MTRPFDIEVLQAIAAHGRQSYGAEVRRWFSARARNPALGSIYAAAERLEAEGLITSHEGEATPERGMRRKRMWLLTNAGLERLKPPGDAP